LDSFFHFYNAWNLKDSPFLESACPTPAVVAISSDEGFLGSLNNQILERAARAYEVDPKTQVIVVGRRGARKLEERGIPVVEFPGIAVPLEYEAILPLKTYLIDQYMGKRIGRAELIFARCQSFTKQSLDSTVLLPFNISKLREIQQKAAEDIDTQGYVILEPDIRRIVEYTIALWFGRKMYQIFWESRLSEAACRALELNDRHENLSRKSQKTRMQYFKAHHEVIDIGIREVFAGHHYFVQKQAEEGE
jgi:ATP synthase F1 gamma subunit